MRVRYVAMLILTAFFLRAGAQVMPSYWWKADSCGTYLNSHYAVLSDSGRAVATDTLPCLSGYTVLTAFRPVDTAEAALWSLVFSDGSVSALSSRRIFQDGESMCYDSLQHRGPVVNMLQQDAPEGCDSTVGLTLAIGGGQEMRGGALIAEVMFFDRRLNPDALRRVQSYLAVKYGVTLAPVDYVDSRGRTVWSHSLHAAHHHRIAGVARDSVYGLWQRTSRSGCDSAVVTLGVDSLAEGDYCLAGDDDAPLNFVPDTWFVGERLARTWKLVQRRSPERIGDPAYSLTVDTALLPGRCDSLVLLVDGRIYYPDTCAGCLRYSGIRLPCDTALAVLARGSDYWERQSVVPHGTEAGTGGNPATAFAYSIYPNPSGGEYCIAVDGNRDVTVRVYNSLGVLSAVYSASGGEPQQFKGFLNTSGVYYVTIDAGDESQTVKLVVR